MVAPSARKHRQGTPQQAELLRLVLLPESQPAKKPAVSLLDARLVFLRALLVVLAE
jgi:hypothetical protein